MIILERVASGFRYVFVLISMCMTKHMRALVVLGLIMLQGSFLIVVGKKSAKREACENNHSRTRIRSDYKNRHRYNPGWHYFF